LIDNFNNCNKRNSKTSQQMWLAEDIEAYENLQKREREKAEKEEKEREEAIRRVAESEWEESVDWSSETTEDFLPEKATKKIRKALRNESIYAEDESTLYADKQDDEKSFLKELGGKRRHAGDWSITGGTLKPFYRKPFYATDLRKQDYYKSRYKGNQHGGGTYIGTEYMPFLLKEHKKRKAIDRYAMELGDPKNTGKVEEYLGFRKQSPARKDQPAKEDKPGQYPGRKDENQDYLMGLARDFFFGYMKEKKTTAFPYTGPLTMVTTTGLGNLIPPPALATAQPLKIEKAPSFQRVEEKKTPSKWKGGVIRRQGYSPRKTLNRVEAILEEQVPAPARRDDRGPPPGAAQTLFTTTAKTTPIRKPLPGKIIGILRPSPKKSVSAYYETKPQEQLARPKISQPIIPIPQPMPIVQPIIPIPQTMPIPAVQQQASKSHSPPRSTIDLMDIAPREFIQTRAQKRHVEPSAYVTRERSSKAHKPSTVAEMQAFYNAQLQAAAQQHVSAYRPARMIIEDVTNAPASPSKVRLRIPTRTLPKENILALMSSASEPAIVKQVLPATIPMALKSTSIPIEKTVGHRSPPKFHAPLTINVIDMPVPLPRVPTPPKQKTPPRELAAIKTKTILPMIPTPPKPKTPQRSPPRPMERQASPPVAIGKLPSPPAPLPKAPSPPAPLQKAPSPPAPFPKVPSPPAPFIKAPSPPKAMTPPRKSESPKGFGFLPPSKEPLIPKVVPAQSETRPFPFASASKRTPPKPPTPKRTPPRSSPRMIPLTPSTVPVARKPLITTTAFRKKSMSAVKIRGGASKKNEYSEALARDFRKKGMSRIVDQAKRGSSGMKRIRPELKQVKRDRIKKRGKAISAARLASYEYELPPPIVHSNEAINEMVFSLKGPWRPEDSGSFRGQNIDLAEVVKQIKREATPRSAVKRKLDFGGEMEEYRKKSSRRTYPNFKRKNGI
jgi:hypothetical protein